MESLIPTERELGKTLKSLSAFTENACESSQSPRQSLFTLTSTKYQVATHAVPCEEASCFSVSSDESLDYNARKVEAFKHISGRNSLYPPKLGG
jgi:hypothetical protein